MHTHKQILMTIAAVIIIAAMGIFAGCKKDDDKIKVSGVSVCPTSVMIYVDETTTLSANVMPSNAADRSVTWKSDNENVATVTVDGIVTAISTGEATITCTTNDGGHPASSTVIVNPKKNDDDYATLILDFYFGNMTITTPISMPVETNNPITVKYRDLNKVKLSVDEAFMGGSVPMKVDCDAELTKVENGYKATGTTTAIVQDNECPVSIDAVFNITGKIDLNIYVDNVPTMGNLVLNFTGTGNMMVNPCITED